jgi:hypothetical protein
MEGWASTFEPANGRAIKDHLLKISQRLKNKIGKLCRQNKVTEFRLTIRENTDTNDPTNPPKSVIGGEEVNCAAYNCIAMALTAIKEMETIAEKDGVGAAR